MSYDILKDTYLESREKLTAILRYSQELSLEDWRVSNLLEKEGLFGKILYAMLEDIGRIKKRDSSILTTKKLDVDKLTAQIHLEHLRLHTEEIEERLTLTKIDSTEAREAIPSYHHLLNRIDDILEDLTLGSLLSEK